MEDRRWIESSGVRFWVSYVFADAASNIVAEVDPSGAMTTHQYNWLNLRTETIAPLSEAVDGDGNVLPGEQSVVTWFA